MPISAAMKLTLLIIWTILLSLYYPLNRRTHGRYLSLPVDARVPLIPPFIIPYAVYGVLIWMPVVALWHSPLYLPYLAAQISATGIATLIWAVYPTGVKRPALKNPHGFFLKTLASLYRRDHDFNACPSGHVYGSVIACYFLSLQLSGMTFLFTLLAVLITLSTLFTKQHYLVDMLAGLMLSVLAILFGLTFV